MCQISYISFFYHQLKRIKLTFFNRRSLSIWMTCTLTSTTSCKTKPLLGFVMIFVLSGNKLMYIFLRPKIETASFINSLLLRGIRVA